MKLITTLSRAAGLGLCVVALSGTALADPGKGNGNGPEATPPGQEQKAETPAATPAPAPQSAQGQEKKAANAPAAKTVKASEPVKTKSKPASAPGQAKKAEKQAEHKPAKVSSASKGQSANAHHHVIICHRTGSLTNPYVVLNIPFTAWTHGHTTHPAKNGNADKILKDPASGPGTKDGFTKADCGAGVQGTVTQEDRPARHILICHRTSSETNPFVIINISRNGWDNGHSKHEGDKVIREDVAPGEKATAADEAFAAANCVSAPAPAAVLPQGPPAPTVVKQVSGQVAAQAPPAAQASAPAGGVAGAVAPAPSKKESGGVLGAIASAPEAIADTAASATLPFTGFPLWIVMLIGIAVLASGLMLRRRATT